MRNGGREEGEERADGGKICYSDRIDEVRNKEREEEEEVEGET